MSTDTNARVSTDQQRREDIARALVEIGERGIAVDNDAALDAYFADDFAFHGPGGDLDYAGLKTFFAAMRHAFSGFTVTRGHIVVDGDYVGAQTTMAGLFERDFTHSPVGTLPPTGEQFTLQLNNIFRYNKQRRLAEEWVQYDQRDMLRQLGAEGR